MVREGVFTHFSWNAECLVTFLVVKSSCSCLVSDIVTERPFLCFDLSQSWSGLGGEGSVIDCCSNTVI